MRLSWGVWANWLTWRSIWRGCKHRCVGSECNSWEAEARGSPSYFSAAVQPPPLAALSSTFPLLRINNFFFFPFLIIEQQICKKIEKNRLLDHESASWSAKPRASLETKKPNLVQLNYEAKLRPGSTKIILNVL